MLQIETYNSREEWLAHRIGIGASDIGSVCGFGFKTPLELWKEKTGQIQPRDLSANERVQFGNKAEEPLRNMFRLMHPEYILDFTPYTILRQEDKYDFLFDTPDGWLTEIETGKRGLYESKTATCLSKADFDKWDNQIPQAYYCQICQGMYCGGFDFAIVWALLINKDNDCTIRAYHFERSECEEDIAWILEKGSEFWDKVQSGTMPNTPLKL